MYCLIYLTKYFLSLFLAILCFTCTYVFHHFPFLQNDVSLPLLSPSNSSFLFLRAFLFSQDNLLQVLRAARDFKFFTGAKATVYYTCTFRLIFIVGRPSSHMTSQPLPGEYIKEGKDMQNLITIRLNFSPPRGLRKLLISYACHDSYVNGKICDI